eukprot:6725330-Pyramimonas_sp.AAC.1
MGSVVDVSGARKPRQARFEQSPQGNRSPLRGAGRGAARAGSWAETAAAHIGLGEEIGRRRDDATLSAALATAT